MPVGLFMNKIESLHSTPSVVVVNTTSADTTLSLTSQAAMKNHSNDLFFGNVNGNGNTELSDECFKYLSKFKTRPPDDPNEQATNDLFLKLMNVGENDVDNESSGKNIKIDTTLLSPMSIPVESTATSMSSSSSGHLFMGQSNGMFEVVNNGKQVDNFNNNSSSSSSNDINNDRQLIDYTSLDIKSELTTNSIPNGPTPSTPSTNNMNELVETTNQARLSSELAQSPTPMAVETTTATSQATGEPRMKNNIDFAIDAVLEKCRNESTCSEDEEMYELITSKSNAKKCRSKKQPTEQMTDPIETLDIPHSQQHIQTDNLNNSINNNNNNNVNSPSLQSPQQQPMSKSSKARTSYISSLIANRQKSTNEDSNQSNAPGNEEDKQKRISQNILTILQQTKNSQLVSNETNMNTSTNNNLTNGDQAQLKPVEIQINSDIQQQQQQQQPPQQPTPKQSKQPKTRKPTQPQNHQPQTSNPSSNNEHQEMDFVINSYHHQSQTHLQQQQQTQFPVQVQPTSQEKLIYMENLDFNQTQHHQLNTTINNVNQDSINSKNVAYIECANLKRILAEPNMDATSLNYEFVNNTNEMKSILMNVSNDRVQVNVKQIKQDSTNNNENHVVNGQMELKSSSSNDKTSFGNIQKIACNPVMVPAANGATNEQKEANSVESVAVVKVTPKRKRPTKSGESKAKKSKLKIEESCSVDNTVQTNELVCAEVSKADSSVLMTNLIQNCITQPEQQKMYQPVLEPAKTTKSKKLKTIADIVKHNSEAQRTKLLQLQPKSAQQQQQDLQQPQPSPVLNNTSLAPPNFIPNNQHENNQQNVNPTALFTGPPLPNDTDMPNINIDQLLELEFNSVNDQSIHSQQLIDKYIDLDDIDLNPLECYRDQTDLQATSFVNSHNNQGNNTNLDEFNLQFSVCSSASSGFSEPSNFSTCSSQNGFNNNLNNSHVFSSESDSSPTNFNANYTQFDNQHINSPQSLPSSYNLFQKVNKLPVTGYNHNMNVGNNVKSNNLTTQIADWNISEFTITPSSILVSNSANETVVEGTGSGNMFGNFSFLSDEMKLEI